MDRSEILQRFEQWLDAALAGEAPPQGIPAELLAADTAPESSPTDWHTMWEAMTALTQEVKLQGRAFKQLSETLAAEAERRGRKESLGALLESAKGCCAAWKRRAAIKSCGPAFGTASSPGAGARWSTHSVWCALWRMVTA
jgi:hypothetical protein